MRGCDRWQWSGIMEVLLYPGLLQQCVGAQRASRSVKRTTSSPRYRQDRLCASVGCRTAAPPLVAGGHLPRESRCLCSSISLQRLSCSQTAKRLAVWRVFVSAWDQSPVWSSVASVGLSTCSCCSPRTRWLEISVFELSRCLCSGTAWCYRYWQAGYL